MTVKTDDFILNKNLMIDFVYLPKEEFMARHKDIKEAEYYHTLNKYKVIKGIFSKAWESIKRKNQSAYMVCDDYNFEFNTYSTIDEALCEMIDYVDEDSLTYSYVEDYQNGKITGEQLDTALEYDDCNYHAIRGIDIPDIKFALLEN